MYNIGVIGDYDSVCGFSAIGFSVIVVDSAEEARQALKKMTGGGYAIIYMTEPLMKELSGECANFSDKAVPSIIPIPAFKGGIGFGKERLSQYMKQAAGSDIIFNEE